MKLLKIPRNEIFNAYLLIGEDKTLLSESAIDFAKFLLSRDSNDSIWKNFAFDSKDEWVESVYKRVDILSHPDLYIISPEGAGDSIKVSSIRENVIDKTMLRPYESEYKIFIIEDADKMGIEAQNAILKTLEEPPEYTVIILLAKSDLSLLPTILSRVIVFSLDEMSIEKKLNEFLEKEWANSMLSLIMKENMSFNDILNFIDKVKKEKIEAADILSFIEIFLRDVICYKSTENTDYLYGKDIEDKIILFSKRKELIDLFKINDETKRAFRYIKENVNKEYIFENLFLTMRK